MNKLLQRALVVVLAFGLAYALSFFQAPATPVPAGVVAPVQQQGAAPIPEKGAFSITPQRRQHILYGDGTGGGHKFGAGKPGKSEFPRSWDDEKIIRIALQIANDEKIPLRPSGRYWLKMGEAETIKIRVVLNREAGEIITAYPLYPGGRP